MQNQIDRIFEKFRTEEISTEDLKDFQGVMRLVIGSDCLKREVGHFIANYLTNREFDALQNALYLFVLIYLAGQASVTAELAAIISGPPEENSEGERK